MLFLSACDIVRGQSSALQLDSIVAAMQAHYGLQDTPSVPLSPQLTLVVKQVLRAVSFQGGQPLRLFPGARQQILVQSCPPPWTDPSQPVKLPATEQIRVSSRFPWARKQPRLQL